MSNFLYQIFGSIQNFKMLESDLHKFERCKWSEAEFGNTESASHQAFKHLAYVNCGFHAIINEKIAFLSKLSWKPPKASSKTLHELFNDIKRDSPVLRLMGLPSMLRALDQELRKIIATERVPALLGQALFDLSVAAIS